MIGAFTLSKQHMENQRHRMLNIESCTNNIVCTTLRRRAKNMACARVKTVERCKPQTTTVGNAVDAYFINGTTNNSNARQIGDAMQVALSVANFKIQCTQQEYVHPLAKYVAVCDLICTTKSGSHAVVECKVGYTSVHSINIAHVQAALQSLAYAAACGCPPPEAYVLQCSGYGCRVKLQKVQQKHKRMAHLIESIRIKENAKCC